MIAQLFIINLKGYYQQMKLIVLIILFAIALSCPENCNDCDFQASFCSACAEGYQRSINGGCVDSNTIPFCNLYGATNQCFSCRATYSLQNGQCIKDYSACLEYDPSDDTSCVSCGFGTVLVNKLCVGAINCNTNTSTICSTCLKGYSLQNGKCIDSTGNCKIIGNNGVCSTCNPGYNLVGYSCINSQVTVYGCYIYDFTGFCQLCKMGYNLYQGNCLLTIQIYQIQRGLSQLSTVLSQRGMVSVTTTTTVTTKTTTVAPTQTTTNDFNGPNFGSDDNSFSNFDGFNGQIQNSIVENCATTNSIGICLSCNPGYYLNKNECGQVSVFCNTYNSQTGECITCKYDLLIKNSQCNDPNCLNQQISGCKLCKPLYSINDYGLCTINDPNCLQTASNACKHCGKGYQVSASGTCSPITSKQPISNCASQVDQICKQCLPGYQISNNICILVTLSGGATTISYKISSRDPNCIKYDESICSMCSNRYYFGPNRICTPVNPICNTYNSNGECLSCYQGYDLSGGICIPFVKTSDTNCKSYNKLGECVSCYSYFYLSQPKRICLPLNPVCKTSNLTNGLCLSCYSGFNINAVGMCALLYSDPYCIKFDSSLKNCAKCASKFFLDSSIAKCRQINPLCKEANQKNGACLSCYEGYILSGSNCIVGVTDVNCKNVSKGICSQCYNGYYLNSSGICAKNNLLCKTNDKNGFCLSCYDGYKLKNQNCIENTSSDSNCKSADKFGKCNSCYSGFYLTQSKSCQKMDALCKTYTTSLSACTSCYDGYQLSMGQCLVYSYSSQIIDPYCQKTQGSVCLYCYPGYYLATSGICILANPLCRQINLSSGDCISCHIGYSLSEKTCIITPAIQIAYCEQIAGSSCIRCIDRFYLRNGNCQMVSQLCNQYDMVTGQCLNCISQYYFFQEGQCIYPSQGIDPFCTYYVNGYCTKCLTGYAVVNYQCIKIDVNCIQYDYYTNNCIACSLGKFPQGPNCFDL